MNKYKAFIFKDYSFDEGTKTLICHYSYDDKIDFSESFEFTFPIDTTYDHDLLDNAIQLLFFIVGVSYFKAYLPPNIEVRKGDIDRPTADFLNKTYQKGLGEFFFVNRLDPQTPISFPLTTNSVVKNEGPDLSSGFLVGLGGGKDSLVSVELLRSQPNVATWMMTLQKMSAPLVDSTGLPNLWIHRTLDSKIKELNRQDALNGHIPFSAILAGLGSVVAILTNRRDVVVSNESSSNEPTLTYQGVDINHQYSKSQEFEADFQRLLESRMGNRIRYYSLLRPFSELRIAELFALYFDKYKKVFTSCNVAAVPNSNIKGLWCGTCPKCAFVFLALTPFIERSKLEALWGDKNLLLDPALDQTYRQLLGIEGDKPLECVGEIKESRAAMRLAQQQYPQLSKYVFDLPADYDYRKLAGHNIPQEVFAMLKQALGIT